MRSFFSGTVYLGRGLRLWFTSPRLMLLGAIPALVVGAVYATGIVLLLVNLDSIAILATPFASGWTEPWRADIRILVSVALVGGVLLFAVFTFAAVTLAVGDPFYERIWRATERSLGTDPPDDGMPWWRSVLGGLRLFALTVLVGALLFAGGLIPVVGQVVVPVLGAFVGGWFLAVELSGFAFEARGVDLRGRRRMLAVRRSRTLGFGVLTYLLFLVPFAAVVIMPAAVAGATLLAHDSLPPDRLVE
ncbi:EI24 domain-containing protein [Lacisediminihabitans sp. FW035]